MTRRAYRTAIPSHATEVVESRHPDGTRETASYFLGGEKVGLREWFEDGQLFFEYAMRNGVKHGPEYRFHENGVLMEKMGYRNGVLHGTGTQWSEDGRLLVTWKLVNSTGLDLWCDEVGHLAEEHYRPRPGELGYHREWNGDEKTVWQEYFYVLGKGYHGVWREWNEQGRIRRGFPRFFVNDQRVTKRQYLRASEADPVLPPYRPEDDDPHRDLPTRYLAQRS